MHNLANDGLNVGSLGNLIVRFAFFKWYCLNISTHLQNWFKVEIKENGS